MTALLLHPDDNVLIVVSPIAPGDVIPIDGVDHRAAVAIGAGHKIARRALKAGEGVIKYGAPIGSMTRAAQAGDHIHVHNMKSDYIATHLRDTLDRSST